MTIIADIYDKIGSVIKEMRSKVGTRPSFTTDEVYALYVKRYPGDLEVMKARQRGEPTSHSLEGYLNGMIYEYSKKTDGRDPDRPTITFLSEMTYRVDEGT